MNFFSQLIAQLSGVFGSQNAARRGIVFAVMALSLAGLGYMIVRAKTGPYKTLYSNMQPSDAAEAASKLQMAQIPARFGENGATLQVPAGKFDQALMILAQEGLPSSGTPGYDELMGKSNIGVSDFELKVRYHRSLEGELARTIMAINGVERARVHLALPKPTLFVRETAKPTASVVLKLRSGARLTDKEVNGIVLLVSGAVEGLESKAVSIIDQDGKLLNQTDQPEEQAIMSDRIAYKLNYENLLKERIESMLGKTVGDGKVVAHVNADFDFAQRTTTEERFDPDSQVARRETILDEGPAGNGLTPTNAGGAGSDSNLPPPGSPSGGFVATGAAKSRNDRETEYEISKTTAQVVETVPLLHRITVSVLVDGTYDEVDDGEGGTRREFVARDASEMATYEEAVKNVIGYSEDRPGGVSDMVTVKSVAFQLNEVEPFAEEAEPLMNPDLLRDLIQWGIVALIGLLLIFTVLRPAMKSVSVVQTREALAGGAAGALPEGAAARGVGGPAGGVALPSGESESGSAIGETKNQIQRQTQLTFELGNTTAQDLPKAARVLRQWLEEKRS